jgi:hypothetical protein
MYWCVPVPLTDEEIKTIKKDVVKERKDALDAKMAAMNTKKVEIKNTKK